MKKEKCIALITFIIVMFYSGVSFSHGVDSSTEQFLNANNGIAIGPFLYIGAKHMITGYDHILFLVGVIFFLYRGRDILLYVSLFTIGHSLTLLTGVFFNISINAYLIDAVIAFSIVYKGFDNLGGFKRIFGFQPNTKIAVLVFGLIHGFGLAAKLIEFSLPQEHLLTNLIAFNLGVEIGQCVALLFVLTILSFWRRFNSYSTFSTLSNSLLMTCGFVLLGYQLTGYFTTL